MSTSATPTTAPTSTPPIRSNAATTIFSRRSLRSAPSTSNDDDHEDEDRHECPGIRLDVVRVDQRGDRVAQVGGGEAREEDAHRAEDAADQSVTPTQVRVDRHGDNEQCVCENLARSAVDRCGYRAHKVTVTRVRHAGTGDFVTELLCATAPAHVPQRRLRSQDLRSPRRADRPRLRRAARVRPGPVHHRGAHGAATARWTRRGRPRSRAWRDSSRRRASPRPGAWFATP